ncbi:MAG: hypothetical protein M1838_005294 [Thelocarpon superellum]|nr:MAG: hypothetical protein M1838_005294 [Thelocarpon superellum]
MPSRWITPLLLVASMWATRNDAVSVPFHPPTAHSLRLEGLNVTKAHTVARPPRPQGDPKVSFSHNHTNLDIPNNKYLRMRQAPPAVGTEIDRSSWTITADISEGSHPPTYAIDGDPNTFWHSEWDPYLAPLPHNITVDMQVVQNVNGIGYLPRQDLGVNPSGGSNGNIGEHQILLSTDGVHWGSPVAIGTYIDNNITKYTTFETVPARYVQLRALSEAGNRGPWSSIAEFNVFAAPSYAPPPTNLGSWGATIDFPLVIVSAAVEQGTGNVLVWASSTPWEIGGGGSQTYTATYFPANQTVSQMIVTNTNHDMFCVGLSTDFNGSLIVTGGDNDYSTSIYDQSLDAWVPGPYMQIPRGYQASATTSDGRTFTIGGSWAGGYGGKNGEVYDPTTGAWSLLPGCPVAPMLTDDAQGVYRADNHAWLFGWKNGSVFQAGPSLAMNWYGTEGEGSQSPAGPRAGDADAMCGNAVMFDAVAGQILTVGGATNYQQTTASSAAHVVTIGAPGGNAAVNPIGNMSYERIFANGVVLPNGHVFITGGQSFGIPFSDNNLDLTPEIWDPDTQLFTPLLSNSIARVYHSVALLMLDGTVFSGGGGLCGETCSTNHFDAQVFTPPYLLNDDGSPATRPAITSVSGSTVAVGGSLTVTTDSSVGAMSLVRYGSTTHTVNTDQRRIPLSLETVGTNKYTFAVPNDPGVALPGAWMLFALNDDGVPSIAETVQITP